MTDKKSKVIFILFLEIVIKIQNIVGYANPNYTVPATTVQRIETFSNGCYTQIVRQPDFSNIQRFYETEQLICPPGVNITTSNHTNLAAYPVPNTPSNYSYATVYHPNNTQPPYAPSAPVYNPPYIQPAAHVPIVPIPQPAVPVASNPGFAVPPPSVPSNSNPSVLPQPNTNPSAVHHQTFQQSAGGIPANNISHIVLLSNRTGFYDHGKRKNDGNSLRNINCIFVFVCLTIFCNYY